MAQALDRLVGDASALILIPEKNEDYERVIRSTNNLPDAKTLLVNYLNIRDLLGYRPAGLAAACRWNSTGSDAGEIGGGSYDNIIMMCFAARWLQKRSNYQNSELHQYVFEVATDATKSMVKDAVETMFDVKVVRVNVINVPAKRKRSVRSRRTTNRRSQLTRKPLSPWLRAIPLRCLKE